MKLSYAFTEKDFVAKCAENVRRSGTNIYQDIIQALVYFLEQPEDLKNLISELRHGYDDDAYYRSPSHELSLPYFIEVGELNLWYVRLDLYSSLENPLDIKKVLLPCFLEMIPIHYGANVKKTIEIKQHELKTKNRTTVNLLHIRINKNTLKKISAAVKGADVELMPDYYGVWHWEQTFYNKITGKAYFCDCFKTALEKSEFINRKNCIIRNAKKTNKFQSDRNPDPHPHFFYAITHNASKEGICHLCTGKNSDLFYCHPMYCSAFRVRYGAYIKKISIEEDINERDAENIVRGMKGIAKIGERWINETLLFNYIDVLFPCYTVEREASPVWLGQQRLDIYIAELNLAIEYQGEQHYKAIDHFGGKEGLKATKERDKLKAEKCKKQKIDLIYFTYKDYLSEKLVGRRLNKYIEQTTPDTSG